MFSAESALNTQSGRINLLASTRYLRARVRIPYGTAWNFVAGVEPDIATEGKR